MRKLISLAVLLMLFPQNHLIASDYCDTIFYSRDNAEIKLLINNMLYRVTVDKDLNVIINDTIVIDNQLPINSYDNLDLSFYKSSLLIKANLKDELIFLSVNFNDFKCKHYIVKNSTFLFFDKQFIYYQLNETKQVYYDDWVKDETFIWGFFRINFDNGLIEEICNDLTEIMHSVVLNNRVIMIGGKWLEGGELLCDMRYLYEFNEERFNITLLNNDFEFYNNYFQYNSYHSNYCTSIVTNAITKSFIYHITPSTWNLKPLGYIKLYNESLDCIGNALSRNGIGSSNYYGYIINNEIIEGVYLRSIIDSIVSRNQYVKVIIPTFITPEFDIISYRLITSIITEDELDGFTSHQLRLLRNFVFAKHNYGFKDKYLQAFFNLYHFYSFTNPKNRNRLSDVSHLLTEADKANLALIRAAEARAKE
jgi:hypothetical protein